MGSVSVSQNSGGDFLPPQDIEQDLVDDFDDFRYDPLECVMYSFPWGEGELAESNGPRVWQREMLESLRDYLRNPDTRHTPFQLAISSGHGIGKSADVAFIIHWALSTWEDARVVITANTGDQLATKTVPEVKKWFRRAINSHWFNVRAETIKVLDPKHADTWRADFVTWSLERTEAFAGLHNERKIIVLIFDESSGIPDKIWEVAEGALTDEDTVIVWLAYGNPTQNTGRFRECFGKFSHRWKRKQIDSRTVEGTNKEQIAKWIEDYGEDSDFVRVRVRGEFPRAGSNQFISSDVVAAARRYKADGYSGLPKILSVDVARFGDDQSVIGIRQGRKLEILGKYRGLDTVQVAGRVIEFLKEHNPDATVVDGDGIGAGVIDHLKHQGFSDRLFEFHGGATPRDPAMYYNRRAEVWGAMREWLNAGAQIPDDPELADDLVGPEYGFSAKQQIQLERKEDMKKRGLQSPDSGDMLAMSFGVTVYPKPPDTIGQQGYYGDQGWMA